MKHLPLGIQSFATIIKDNYLYIDKTEYIHRLLAEGGKYFFLSRPRRFGKSLLISTLAEIFSGNKELFKGLWIYDKIQWEKYPIIQIDFSVLNYKTPERLEETLGRLMDDLAQSHGVSLDPKRYYNEKFYELIKKISSNGKVIILIDEYDKPIIDRIEDIELAKQNRDILRDFYGVIKNADKDIKFTFITGVSKFSRVSVFSGLNNLRDITLSDEFATLLGYTKDEMTRYFSDRIESLSQSLKLDIRELTGNIKKWYNGYSWDGNNFVYNPHSILNFFTEKSFKNYWFATGTPSFLVELLKGKQKDVREFENKPVGDYVFESYNIESLDTTSLLFQTGYLTIKKSGVRDNLENEYILTYPNKEVRDSLLHHLFGAYTGKELGSSTALIRRLNDALIQHSYEEFFEIIKSLFASISYNIFIQDREAYYHSIIYMIFKLMGAEVRTEVQTVRGRIDVVVETPETIYVMEFKMGTAREALDQIEEKKYYEAYSSDTRTIKLVGIGFSLDQKNIHDYKIQICERGRCL